MKKLAFGIMILCAVACSSTKNTTGSKPLYEVLTKQSTGGATIRFYEILTETKEIEMLKGDETIAQKISDSDLTNSTFVILNMGEQTTGGFRIDVDSVEETPDKIIITVKDITPESGAMVTQAFTYPYSVVKINSRKPVEIN